MVGEKLDKSGEYYTRVPELSPSLCLRIDLAITKGGFRPEIRISVLGTNTSSFSVCLHSQT